MFVSKRNLYYCLFSGCVHQICSINACHVLYLFSFIYNCNLDSIHLTLLHSAQITVECQHCKQLQFIDGRNIWDSLCDTQLINVCHFYYFKKLCRMDFKARQPLLLNLYLYKTVFEVWMQTLFFLLGGGGGGCSLGKGIFTKLPDQQCYYWLSSCQFLPQKEETIGAF